MSISNYAELKILDHTTGTASWTMPSGVYVKLHTGDPGEAGTSNAATEATRKVITFSAAASVPLLEKCFCCKFLDRPVNKKVGNFGAGAVSPTVAVRCLGMPWRLPLLTYKRPPSQLFACRSVRGAFTSA